MNYADEAKRFNDSADRSEMAVLRRTEELQDQAWSQILHRYGKLYRNKPEKLKVLAESLHRDLCAEDLDRQAYLADQQHYHRKTIRALGMAQLFDHKPTGVIYG